MKKECNKECDDCVCKKDAELLVVKEMSEVYLDGGTIDKIYCNDGNIYRRDNKGIYYLDEHIIAYSHDLNLAVEYYKTHTKKYNFGKKLKNREIN